MTCCSAGFLDGPPAAWVEQLAGQALDEGMSSFILASDDPDMIRRFAAEVAPGVQELVAAERVGQSLDHAVAETVRRSDVTAVPGLGYGPTPDTGVRLSSERVWDEALRPTGPAPQAGRIYTAHEQATGHHLIDVHDGLRGELEQLRELIRQVAEGVVGVGTARSAISQMTLRQNAWTLGVYCAQYCRVVTTHHSIEDQSTFPFLRSSDPALVPVLDRLAEEHHVIHDLLDRVDRALVDMVEADLADPSPVQAAVDLMTDALLSHLSYEERELVEPLARLGFA